MKITLLLTALLLLIPLVISAPLPADPETITWRTFNITVDFDEPVDIINDQGTITANYEPFRVYAMPSFAETPAHDSYRFRNTNTLPNGNYTFTFEYTKSGSAFSGIRTFTKRIEVAVEGEDIPYLFDINLINPPSGFHNESPPYNITLSTTLNGNPFNAECRYSFNALPPEFEDLFTADIETDGNIHTLNYKTNNVQTIYWIACRDPAIPAFESYKKFVFGWVNGVSEITGITQNPDPIEDWGERYTDLIISAEDLSVCTLTYTNGPGPGDISHYPDTAEFQAMLNNLSQFKKTNEIRVCFRDADSDCLHISQTTQEENSRNETKYNVTVECFNRGWIRTFDTYNVSVKYSDDARLSYVKPERYVSEQPVGINLMSRLTLLGCEYRIDDGSWKDYNTNDNKNYTASEELSEGNYVLHSRCTSRLTPEYLVPTPRDFTVDRIYPADFVYELPARVCEDAEFDVNWSAEDETSGIDRLHYEIKLLEEVLEDGSSSRDPAEIELDLDAGIYTFSPWVTDVAGNIAQGSPSSIEIVNKSNLMCDDKKPDVEVIIKNESETETVYVVKCEDDESGCKQDYKFNLWQGNKKSDANCTYDENGVIDEDYSASVTSILCYQVEDEAGNVREGKEKIGVQYSEDQCTNGVRDGDETGIDCGGSCDSCGTGITCVKNGDCDSGVCDKTINMCEENPFECYSDIYCEEDEYCSDSVCKKKSTRPPSNETIPPCVGDHCEEIPGCVGDHCDEDDTGGINWMALIVGVFGIMLLGGGGYFYYAGGTVTPTTKSLDLKKAKNPNVPEFKLQKDKKLNYKDTKKVKELRNKLTKERTAPKRKSLLRAFETPEKVDKELPSGVEKMKKDLLPKEKPAPKTAVKKEVAKPKPAKKTEKKAEKPKKTEEYVDISKVKKKKDIFDELEDL